MPTLRQLDHPLASPERQMERLDRTAVPAFDQVMADNDLAALETADRIAVRVETGDERYALGFVEGVEAGSGRNLRNCEATLSSSFSRPYRSGWKDEDNSWKDGFEDGSHLAYSLIVVRRLQGCFLPVPASPE